MGTCVSDIPQGNSSIFLLLTILAATVTPAQALNPWPRDSNSSTCPSAYERCSSPNLPSNFCCPSSAACISLDDASSAICCPKGQNCSYIKPITCDVALQDPGLFPKNPVKTSRLNDRLPRCGRSCCPFGYACMGGNTCARETILSSSTTTTTSEPVSPAPSTSTSTISTTSKTTTTSTSTSQTTTEPSPSPSTTSTPLPALNCTTSESAEPHPCPAFPSKAIVAGFFPGAVFGAFLALLVVFLLRKRQTSLSPSHKTDHYYGHYHPNRSSDGTVLGISDPIPSHDSSYRTDFLLRRGASNTTTHPDDSSARAVLRRTGTRVKSFFSSSSSTHRSNQNQSAPNYDLDHPVPPLPRPATPPSQIKVPPKQRQRRVPSTESITVYSPAGAWPEGSNRGRNRPEHHAHAHDHAQQGNTFAEMMDRVGFRDGSGDPCFRVDGMETGGQAGR
ncbi:hypothetical protein PHISP_07854 [Aspergillus sp. HF37]|nr:hypothetical protein PHISP_07854 [Aspergillus sp. HF37]